VPHIFNHIMVREEQDIPNWATAFFLKPGVLCDWGKFIWSSSILPSKTLVLWKVFYGRLPTDQHIQNKALHICYMCTLCEKYKEFIQHLFFECSNALHIFGAGFGRFFLLLISLIRMIFFLLLRVMVVLWLN